MSKSIDQESVSKTIDNETLTDTILDITNSVYTAEHIDWTNATDDFKTTGSSTLNGEVFIPNGPLYFDTEAGKLFSSRIVPVDFNSFDCVFSNPGVASVNLGVQGIIVRSQASGQGRVRGTDNTGTPTYYQFDKNLASITVPTTISGTLAYTGSTPTDGYFLQTDGSGNASWQPVDLPVSTTHSTVFTGPFTSPSITIQITKIGNTVWLVIPRFIGTSTVAAGLTASTALPVDYRPTVSTAIMNYAFGIDGGLGAEVQVRVFTSGVIELSVTNAGLAFQNTGSAGLNAQTSICYEVA